LVPLTVFTAKNETITCGWLRNQVELYKSYDDVFEDFFMQGKARESWAKTLIDQDI
jgi:hypothetical protein